MSHTNRELLEVTGKVLLRCGLFGFAAMLFWAGAFLLAGDLIYNVHGEMFDLSKHELNVMHYAGMGIFKLVVFVFFFFPWLAIKMVLLKSKPVSVT